MMCAGSSGLAPAGVAIAHAIVRTAMDNHIPRNVKKAVRTGRRAAVGRVVTASAS
jgi:hypothetical protein